MHIHDTHTSTKRSETSTRYPASDFVARKSAAVIPVDAEPSTPPISRSRKKVISHKSSRPKGQDSKFSLDRQLHFPFWEEVK